MLGSLFSKAQLITALLASAAVLIAGCASPPSIQIEKTAVPASLFADAHFRAAPHVQAEISRDLLEMSPEMRTFMRTAIDENARFHGPQRGLVLALYRENRIALTYDASRTYTAREAFAAKSGNCISLVLMTAAFAKALGLPVTFNAVVDENVWTRTDDLHVLSGHVNVTVGKRMGNAASVHVRPLSFQDTALTVDFLPVPQGANFRALALREATVEAMYFNNRAAELLTAGHTNDAYWMAREAVRRDADFLPALNTLALVYRRSELPALAEAALRRRLARDPDNFAALTNLGVTLNAQGKHAEAAEIIARAAALEPHPPFHFFELGLNALNAGAASVALAHFQREARRDPEYHETHLMLARAYAALGDAGAAERHLERATAFSTSSEQRLRYQAKLAQLARLRAVVQ